MRVFSSAHQAPKPVHVVMDVGRGYAVCARVIGVQRSALEALKWYKVKCPDHFPSDVSRGKHNPPATDQAPAKKKPSTAAVYIDQAFWVLPVRHASVLVGYRENLVIQRKDKLRCSIVGFLRSFHCFPPPRQARAAPPFCRRLHTSPTQTFLGTPSQLQPLFFGNLNEKSSANQFFSSYSFSSRQHV